MLLRLALVLAAGALAAPCASAQPASQPASADPRLPVADAAATPLFAYRVVWPAGVRRWPALQGELDRAARSERTSYRGIMESQRGRPDEGFVRFERGAQERFASDRFASLVVETRLDGDRVWARPLTWDAVRGRAIGWRDILAESHPNAPALQALHAYVTARATPPLLSRVGTRTGRDWRDTVGWMAPRLEAMPAFTLVPAREPGRMAGLTVHLGERSGFGVTGGTEIFVPADVLAPHLAEGYRDLFGGEPHLVDPATRRAADEAQRGLPAFVHGPDVAPTRVLVVRGEAPAIYFGPAGLDAVLDPGGPGAMPLPAQAGADAGAEPSGIAWAMRPFQVTFRSVKPLANGCRGEAIHLVPGRGSPAEAAGLGPIALPVPVKPSCEGRDG